ncbi:MAG: hypothetical protein AAEJ04_11240, partial [Planctomycetota bacterium]
LAETQFLSQESDPPRHGTLLHELTHHFTADQPGLQSRWWLTEAFACYFETAFPAPDGRFILPPLHIENYRSSRAKLREIGQQKFSKLIEQIVAANWLEFYRNDGDAPLRYAISWSILWTLQQQMSGELEDRLLQVAQLDNQEILDRIESVIQAITPPISSQLRDHVSSEPYRRWSVENWLNGNRIDGPLILSAIEKELLEDEGKIWGWPCVARTIFRWGSGLDRATRLEWQNKVERQLREGPLAVRLAICQVLTGYRRSGALIPVLVDLLDSSDGPLRAAAATALSRASNHPTIVNPVFWIRGSAADRQQEIENWRRWLDSP